MLTHRVKLTFKENLIRKPLIHEVALCYNIITNIREANITNEAKIGWVILDISGDKESVEQALTWLCYEGVKTEFVFSNMYDEVVY